MSELKKYGLITLIVLILLAALIFFSLNIPNNRDANVVERSLQSALSPFMKPAAAANNFIADVWNGYVNLVDVHQENVRMIREIKELNSRMVAADEALLENQRLKRLLEMKENIRDSTVTASVIGEDMSGWFHTLTIDRGSSSGVREGMAVMAADGIVGQIIKVSQGNSRVLLLTDHASGIAATIQRSRARGVVKGKGEGMCSLEFTTREEDVKVGDQVVASGIGGVFPKSARIGEVSMVKKGEYGIFQTVSIRPAVNTSHLEEVLVILRGADE